jgi:hypothetical protein
MVQGGINCHRARIDNRIRVHISSKYLEIDIRLADTLMKNLNPCAIASDNAPENFLGLEIITLITIQPVRHYDHLSCLNQALASSILTR